MNTNVNPEPDHQLAAAPADPQKAYPPRLVFYHPNSKGTGCAVQFDIRPATSDREGCLFAAFANQKGLAAGSRAGNSRQAATFAWNDKITVKLNFGDVCQLMLVLCGKAPSVADGKGLFHDAGGSSTVIHMSRVAEPVSGTAFEVSKKRKDSSAPAQRARILFTEAESFGLARLFDAALFPLAFGR